MHSNTLALDVYILFPHQSHHVQQHINVLTKLLCNVHSRYRDSAIYFHHTS
nr:MAG TPA: hypothetical protein [Caudoviricetes sp.]